MKNVCHELKNSVVVTPVMLTKLLSNVCLRKSALVCVCTCVYTCVCVPACMCVFSIAWTRIRWEITFGMALQ